MQVGKLRRGEQRKELIGWSNTREHGKETGGEQTTQDQQTEIDSSIVTVV